MYLEMRCEILLSDDLMDVRDSSFLVEDWVKDKMGLQTCGIRPLVEQRRYSGTTTQLKSPLQVRDCW